MWQYTTVEAILPEKFFSLCLEKVQDGWELTGVVSVCYSGFTLHQGKFKKYVN